MFFVNYNFAINKTSLGEQPLVFTGCSIMHIFNSTPSPNTISEAARGSLPVTVQPLSREADDFQSVLTK